MTLDPISLCQARIAAATAANTLPVLREAVTEGLQLGLDKETIAELIRLAQEIRLQNDSYTDHLAHQLLREPKKKPQHTHSASCGCQCCN